MKVGELIDLLSGFNPEAQVVIHKDVEEFGYGEIVDVVPGAFERTDFGNDFFPQQGFALSGQVKAVCLVPEIDKDKYAERVKGLHG